MPRTTARAITQPLALDGIVLNSRRRLDDVEGRAVAQLDLFSTCPAEPTIQQAAAERQAIEARARRDDPASSHEAAERVNRGTAKRHREIVTDLVWKFPGRTSKELAMLVDKPDKDEGIDRHEIARRLPEAEAEGEVYRVEQAGSDLRWHPGRKPE